MEDDNNIWNKKTQDLTIGDAVKLNAVVLIAMIGIPVATFAVIGVCDKIGNKFQTMKANRQKKHLAVVTDTE